MTSPFATPDIDVAVIGGSFAGLSAALMLARGRRRVTVFDTGQTRNRFAASSHGVFGHDGRSPDAIRADARRDLRAYPTVTLIDRAVTGIDGASDAFRVTDADGTVTTARRVILAYGMRDTLPDLPGLADCWGISAVHCPYCHGYELADRPTAVLMMRPGMPHQALMLSEWTDRITVVTAGHDLPAEDRARLRDLGIVIEDRAVAGLDHGGGHLTGLRLAYGARLDCGALYLAPPAETACDLAARLGCATDEGYFGRYLQVDEGGATSVWGVFAAGDLARPVPSAPLAAAQGVMAGTACHRSLMPALA